MAEFHCDRPFGIDDGELDGMTPQQCFVLGYELAMVDAFLELGDQFAKLIHVENRERIETECRKRGRECRFSWMPGDSSESWMVLSVEAK